jgi:hypothetical protein
VSVVRVGRPRGKTPLGHPRGPARCHGGAAPPAARAPPAAERAPLDTHWQPEAATVALAVSHTRLPVGTASRGRGLLSTTH